MVKQKLGLALRLCVTVLRPLATTLTKHDWQRAELLPPRGGFVLVTNHISQVDPVTFAHFVYDSGRLPRFLGKAELFAVRGLGTLLRSAGQIPVHRQSDDASQAFRAAVAAVDNGECVVVYPEGTITRDPGLWPMTGKTGAARIALSTGCPVVPAAQWGAHLVLAPYGKRPSLLPRKTIQVRVGEPVNLDDLRGRELTQAVLTEATDRIMAAITALLAQIRHESAPSKRYDLRAQAGGATDEAPGPSKEDREGGFE